MIKNNWIFIFSLEQQFYDKGAAWLVKNETSINFWHDNWTDWGLLHDSIHGPLNKDENNLHIHDA